MHNYSQENDKTLVTLVLSILVAALLMIAVFYLPTYQSKKSPPTVPLPNFSEIQDIKERKKAFFSFLRPLVHTVNREIEEDRRVLIEISEVLSASDNKFSEQARKQLESMARQYRIDDPELMTSNAIVDTLKLRVNVLPTALVLAQAANESAWGRSRFAVEGNNLFGQWCFEPGCGIVPQARSEGEIYEVALFESPLASIRSYMMNLNTFSAYKEFRKRRQKLIQNKGFASGLQLAEELINYSTRREEYVKEIQAMIRQNHLE